MKKFKLTIQGMHCSSCANNIERSLSKVSGVKEVNVSLLTKKGIILTEDSVAEEELKKAVARTGYSVVAVEQE